MPHFERHGRSGSNLEAVLDLLEQDPGTGDCHAPMDVLETTQGVEVIMDLPGVRVEALSVSFADNTLVITARKTPAGCEHGQVAFHLAERGFGLCARSIRLEGAFDVGRAEARLSAGELRITLPRVEERRGRDIRIPVRAS